jgi:osmotically-inducible protein OsmY
MKNKYLSLSLALIAAPIALFASPDTDRKIEDAAKTSYNFKTVLENQVEAKAHDGVVTLTGTVQDKDDKALAADTVGNLPGVVSVTNEIKVDAKYPEKSDAWIALKIRGTLLVKSGVSATSTKVAVESGIVVLSGTADNLAQKELTTEYAKGIEGVKSVKNEIIVKEVVAKAGDSKTDAKATTKVGDKIDDASITTQVKFALLKHKSTSAIKTSVSTADGVVSITGIAANDSEKALVTKLTKDVRGVNSVSNNMTIKS